MRVFTDKDKVILELGGRKNSMLISVSAARDVAESLDLHAGYAERETPEIATGEMWNAKVESFDGQVGFYFQPPPSHVGNPSRVPLTSVAARRVAEVIRDKANFAEHKMRLVLQRS